MPGAASWLRISSRPAADRFFELGNSISWAGLTPEMGALSVLYAATDPDLPGATFVGPDRLGGLQGYPKIARSSRRSRDERVAAALWERCTEMAAFR